MRRWWVVDVRHLGGGGEDGVSQQQTRQAEQDLTGGRRMNMPQTQTFGH